MIGIIVILLLSWVLLRFTVKQPLSVLGYKPVGVLTAICICFIPWSRRLCGCPMDRVHHHLRRLGTKLRLPVV
jgi:hypothetical protein